MTTAQKLVPRLLAVALLPIPVIGWLAAQTFEERILRNDEFTGALVHTLSTSTFAVVFFASALTNAIIVAARSRYQPRSHRASRYVAWQSALLALAAAWLGCVVAARAELAEFVIAALIAVVSIVVCVFAAKRDPEATRARIERWESRTPEARLRITRIRVLVPVLAVLLAVASLVVVQNIEIVHRDCVVNGSGVFDGDASIFTENCGDFAVEGEAVEQYLGATVDVTTRGFRLGLPLAAHVIDITES